MSIGFSPGIDEKYIKRRNVMKKLLITALMLGAAVFVVPSAAEAKNNGATVLTAGPQTSVSFVQQRRGWNRRPRTVTRTRIVRTRYGTFREVVRTTYFANGRTVTRVISRTRVYR